MSSHCILLLFLCSVVSCFHAGACCSEEQERSNVLKYIFSPFNSSSTDFLFWRNFMEANISEGALHLTPRTSHYSRYTSSLVIFTYRLTLWHTDSRGKMREASFNATFTMKAHQPEKQTNTTEGLSLVIFPRSFAMNDLLNTTTIKPSNKSSVTVDINTVGSFLHYPYHLITIIPPIPDSVDTNYTVQIKYNADEHKISVYADDNKNIHSDQPIYRAPLNITSFNMQTTYLGFYASGDGDIVSNYSIYSWNITVDKIIPDLHIRHSLVLPEVLGSVAATAVIAFVMVAFYFRSRYWALKKKMELTEALKRLPGMPREFKYTVIKKATKNFAEAMKLGQGGFGAVYKGILPAGKDDGRGRGHIEVAVKKFMRNEKRCYSDFLAEIDVINRLRHRNIVPLVGWCYQKGELLLIYEYMSNGSLDQHLFHENLNQQQQQQPILRWDTRRNIIRDIAIALHYVHHEYEQVVLHRDIKASNIMLDSTFNARLGDFGLARIVALDRNSFTDLHIAGTWGFIAPECPMSHKATRQTDVYAFGVLVLEIVTGKRSLHRNPTFMLLTDWVWSLHREGRLLEAVDGQLVTGGFDVDDANRLLLLGLACSHPNPSDRPNMTEVLQVISMSAPPPDVPIMKPTFVWPPEGGFLLDFNDMMMINDHDWNCLEEASSTDGLTVTRISQPNISGEDHV